MIELKDCPFCGGPVHWCGSKIVEPDDELHTCHHIACPNCGDFDLSKRDDAETHEELHAICAARWNKRAQPSGQVLVEQAPDPALLVSMAMRVDHGFGLLEERAREVALDDMRKVHEEVVGTGYYRADVRERYAPMVPVKMQKASEKSEGSA